MNWKSIDEKLIKRGGLLLSLDFLKNYDNELRIMNNNKIGHSFKITNEYIKFLAIIRYLFSMPYRKIEGFTRSLNKLIPKLPSIDYSWIRRRIIKLDLNPYKYLRKYNGPIIIAIDSSGIKVHKSGEWIERIYRKKKYIKIHFARDVKTKEVVSMEVILMKYMIQKF
jgi:hypothetical protein